MKLERSDTLQINNPVEKDLIEAFSDFGNTDPDDFIILSKNDMTYIQSANSDFEGEGLILEFQEGNLDNHFQCTDTNISKEIILDAFLAYLNEDNSWKEKFIWEKYTLCDDDL